MAISRKGTDEAYFSDPANLGRYQRTSLDDIINNFIVAYVGNGKTLNSVPRYEVAFHAQRAMQEFSYDTLRAEKHIEIELNADTLSFPLPADYVDYVKLTYLDIQGNEVPAYPSRIQNYKQAPLQDNNYDYLYDEEGEQIYAETAENESRIQDPNLPYRGIDFAQTEYYNYYYDDDYSYYYNAYYGRRFGRNPEFSNRNGTFVLDEVAGRIYFNWVFAESRQPIFVNLRYVSDGIGDGTNADGTLDLKRVYIHKFAEGAIYAYLLYNLSKVRPSAAGAAGLYKQEMKAMMRNAKIRLTRYNLEELTQIMRGKAKWIKH